MSLVDTSVWPKMECSWNQFRKLWWRILKCFLRENHEVFYQLISITIRMLCWMIHGVGSRGVEMARNQHNLSLPWLFFKGWVQFIFSLWTWWIILKESPETSWKDLICHIHMNDPWTVCDNLQKHWTYSKCVTVPQNISVWNLELEINSKYNKRASQELTSTWVLRKHFRG